MSTDLPAEMREPGTATSRVQHRFALRGKQARRQTPVGQRADWRFMIGLIVVLGAAAIAYLLSWSAVVHHQSYCWAYPQDIWFTIRTAHWIGWGDLSYVYSSHTYLVTLPGFPVLLAPVVKLTAALGLSESSPGIWLFRPTAYLVILPYCLLLSSTALFAFDRLARCLDVPRATRRLLSVAELAGIFSVVVLWGHPEDVLAAAFLTWAIVATFERRLVAAGWFLGAAIAMQLYVILLVPLFIGIIGRRLAPSFMLRAALLPGCLLGAVMIPNFHGSLTALLDQPNWPTVDHPTPWVLLAPKLADGAVAAGPSRIVALVAAVWIGVLGSRHRDDLRYLAWLAAIALTARCVFESVVDPYYVIPAIAIAIIVAGTLRPIRLWTAIVAGGGLTVMTYSHPDKWAYWFEMTGLFVVMLAAARPHRPVATTPEDEDRHDFGRLDTASREGRVDDVVLAPSSPEVVGV